MRSHSGQLNSGSASATPTGFSGSFVVINFSQVGADEVRNHAVKCGAPIEDGCPFFATYGGRERATTTVPPRQAVIEGQLAGVALRNRRRCGERNDHGDDTMTIYYQHCTGKRWVKARN